MMNKQRKTSNILNILTYDDLGNVVIKDYSQVVRYSWNGLVHAFDGPLSISSISAAVTDTDRFLVSDGGVIKYRTGAELLSDIGGQPLLVNPVTGTGVSGQVSYWSGTNTQTGSNNLFWDAANERLGIGTNAPATILQISKAAGLSHIFTVTNTSASGGYSGSFNLEAPNLNNGEILYFNIGKQASNYDRASFTYYHSANASTGNRFSISFYNADNILNVFASKNVTINSTTDSGYRLDVNGTARVQGNLNVSTGGATIVGNSSITHEQNGNFQIIGSGGTEGTITIRNSSSNNRFIETNSTGTFTIRNSGNGNITLSALRTVTISNSSAGYNIIISAAQNINLQSDIVISDEKNITLNATTGTKIGTATTQKLSLWNATPDVQPTTAITAAAFVANTSGIVDDTATFGGYTLGQIVAALKRIGALA